MTEQPHCVLYALSRTGETPGVWVVDSRDPDPAWRPLEKVTGLTAEFSWGRADEGAKCLAWAICKHAVGEQRAYRVAHSFKWRVLALEERDVWALTRPEVIAVVEQIELERDL